MYLKKRKVLIKKKNKLLLKKKIKYIKLLKEGLLNKCKTDLVYSALESKIFKLTSKGTCHKNKSSRIISESKIKLNIKWKH